MTKTQLPQSPLESKFGWPRLKREEEFTKLRKAENLPTHRVVFQEKTDDFPIIRVPIELPKYRLENGRTSSSQEEYLAKNPKVRADLFTGDPELLDAQQVQHALLLALAKQANLLPHFRDPASRQVDPILLDEMGFVVNGNRRLATWRFLLAEDPKKFGHFSHIDVVVLPHCDEREIDRLEAALQIEPDIKADYSWDAQANMMLQKRKRDGFSDKDLADLYRMKESEVRELIDMRNYADEYLRARGKEHHWSLVTDNEFAFRKLVTNRPKLTGAGEQELFKQAAFVLIDNPEEVGGRLYEAIPRIQEFFEPIKNKLQEQFKVDVPQMDSGRLDELFGGLSGQKDTSMPLAVAIRKQENIEQARKIIVEVIESQQQLKKESKSANYLLDCLAKANALLSAGIRESLRPETNKGGLEAQLQQLKKQIHKIESWLTQDA